MSKKIDLPIKGLTSDNKVQHDGPITTNTSDHVAAVRAALKDPLEGGRRSPCRVAVRACRDATHPSLLVHSTSYM